MPICIVKHKKEGQNEDGAHAESAQLALGLGTPRSRGVAPRAGRQPEGRPRRSAPELLPATATSSSQRREPAALSSSRSFQAQECASQVWVRPSQSPCHSVVTRPSASPWWAQALPSSHLCLGFEARMLH